MTTIREARPALPPRTARPAAPAVARRPFRDNPRLILLGIVVLAAALVATITLTEQSTELSPDFLSGVVLYALSAADLTILVVLLFVLARYFVKLAVERRRGLPFSRFRFKLVLALLGLTIIPSVLVLLVGGRLIRDSTQRWFSAPVEEVVGSAKNIALELYRERERQVRAHAARIAQNVAPAAVAAGNLDAIRAALKAEITQGRVKLVEIYRIEGGQPVPLVAMQSPALPRGQPRAAAERLAARIAAGSSDNASYDALDAGGELVRSGAPVRDASGAQVGVVIAGDLLSGELASESRRIASAFERYQQLQYLRRPLEGVYISFFLMITLMILLSATWTGWYLAKRITRPVQLLAAGAREIGAGRLDHRIEPETRDEFGSLVEAFNTMAAELAASRKKLERSRLDLEQKNVELDERRHYIETVVERIATGVISLDAEGRIETINSAALRLLEVDRSVVGSRADEVLAREDLRPLQLLLRHTRSAPSDAAAQEVALAREGRELHVAAAVTPLHGEDGSPAGAVLVIDDVTPLIRAQRVAAWRDVARRLAHEIKNPLTPIQLCAERMRRHSGGARAGGGVHGDDRGRGRVAEGAGRRVRPVRTDAGAPDGTDRPQRAARRDARAL